MMEEERKRHEEQRLSLLLQDKINKLEEALKAKKAIASMNVKDRVGPKNTLQSSQKVSVFARISNKEVQRTNTSSNTGQLNKKRKLDDIKLDQGKKKYRKNKKNYGNNNLPEDLVLTTITDQGPKKAKASRIIYNSLPAELVLTELTEDGPKPVNRVMEDDDDVVLDGSDNEQDLD